MSWLARVILGKPRPRSTIHLSVDIVRPSLANLPLGARAERVVASLGPRDDYFGRLEWRYRRLGLSLAMSADGHLKGFTVFPNVTEPEQRGLGESYAGGWEPGHELRPPPEARLCDLLGPPSRRLLGDGGDDSSEMVSSGLEVSLEWDKAEVFYMADFDAAGRLTWFSADRK
jgi:hypothetical protein